MERVRATGLPVDLAVEGTPFPLGAAAELTAYRIVQEALTNTLRHAAARHAWVTIVYDASPRSGCRSPMTAPRMTALRNRRAAAGGMALTACANGPRCTGARCAPGRSQSPQSAQIPRRAGWSKPPSSGPHEHLHLAGR